MGILLSISKLKRSTFYYYLKLFSAQKEDKYAQEKEAIKQIFEENKSRYGYRRVHIVLRKKGFKINHKTTQKIMQNLNLFGKQRRSKYKSYRGGVGKVAANVLDRNFVAEAPYEKLVTDITEFSVCDERIYLSPILDLFNSEILAYSISSSPNFNQIRSMLDKLYAVLPVDARPLIHSDQGWQYQMREFQDSIAAHNISQSMSRKGNCLDNSVMENFFGRLKVEMFFREKFETIEDFKQKLSEYICYFNEKRVSLKRKGMSPVEYKAHFYKNH